MQYTKGENYHQYTRGNYIYNPHIMNPDTAQIVELYFRSRRRQTTTAGLEAPDGSKRLDQRPNREQQ